MPSNRNKWAVLAGLLLPLLATAGELPGGVASTELPPEDNTATMPSIIINQKVEKIRYQTHLRRPSKAERKYWQCVLEHTQGVQSDDAMNVILVACRALQEGHRL